MHFGKVSVVLASIAILFSIIGTEAVLFYTFILSGVGVVIGAVGFFRDEKKGFAASGLALSLLGIVLSIALVYYSTI